MNITLLEKELKAIENNLNYDTIRNAAQDETDARLQEVYQKIEKRLPENQEALLISFVTIMKGYSFAGNNAISCVYNCAVAMIDLIKELKLYGASVHNSCSNLDIVTTSLIDAQKKYISAKEEYKGEIFLLEDGEEEEYIPISKNILSFVEQIAANL